MSNSRIFQIGHFDLFQFDWYVSENVKESPEKVVQNELWNKEISFDVFCVVKPCNKPSHQP